MRYITIPDTGINLIEGDIVILESTPTIKSIIHYGDYLYNRMHSVGWYVSQVPTNIISPLTEDQLVNARVIYHRCVPNPKLNYPGPLPSPPPPNPQVPFRLSDRVDMQRSWISVDTLQARDSININLLTDGKIVRVNNIGNGNAGYYRWDAISRSWVVETFGISVDLDALVTKEELPDVVNQIINTSPIILELSESVEWQAM